jgi:hypothetical protein
VPPCNQLSLGVQWRSNEQTATYSPLVAGDMDKDGIPDILTYLAESNKIYLLDGKTGATKLSVICPTMLPGGTAPAIADLDNDGYGEFILIGQDRLLRCWEHDGTLKYQSTVPVGYDASYQYSVPNIADFDHNGWAEINVGNQVFNGQTGALLAQGGANVSAGEHPARKITGYSFASTVAVDALPSSFCADCDGLEIVAGNQVLSVNLVTGICTPVVTAAAPFTDGFTSVADFDGDGDLDAIVQGRKGSLNTVYCWEIETPQVIRQYQLINNYYEGASRVNIADLNGDGQLELSFVGHPRLYALKNDFTLMWDRPANDPSSITCSSVFDFCGDGSADVVYRGSSHLMVLEGATGFIKWQDLCGSGTHIENPLILDVDADGQTEIVTQCEGAPAPGIFAAGNVVVYEAVGSPGINSRRVWNQHAYMNTNINDDLSVPRYQQNPHIVGDSLRINTFLNQYYDPTFPSPDVRCLRDSMEVTLTFCNVGDKPLPPTTPLSIYKNNPQTTNAPFVGTVLTGFTLQKDSCRTVKMMLPRIANDSVFLVLNDDHSLLLPYDLDTDFPATAIGECTYKNNIVSFSYKYNPAPLSIGPDTAICANTTLALDAAGQDYVSWEWQNGTVLSTFTAPGAGLYSVTISDICGNTQTAQVNISIDPATVVSLGADRQMCEGETVALSESGFDFYQWLPVGSVSCANCPNVQASPAFSGNVILQAGFANGCVNRDTVFVTVHDTFNIKIDTTICFGREVDWNGTSIAPGNEKTFFFQSFHGCDSTVQVRVKGTTVGTFYVEVDTAVCLGSTLPFLNATLKPGDERTFLLNAITGCDSTVVVDVLPKDTFYVTENPTICYGESLSIFGNMVSSSGTYQDVFKARNGCDSTHTVYLTVLTPILLTLETQSACVAEANGQVLVSATGGAPPFDFVWTTGASAAGMKNLLAGPYGVTVTDNNDCTETASATVANFPDIVYDAVADSVRCYGEATGRIQINTADSTLAFSLNGGLFAQVDAYENLRAGAFTLLAQDVYGCTDTLQLDIGQPNEFLISLPDDATIDLGDSLLLDIQSTSVGPYKLIWNDSTQLSQPQSLQSVAKPYESRLYAVTVFDKNGCQASDEITIIVQRLIEVFAPNVFATDAVDEQNRYFAVGYGPAISKVKSLQVWDRWGNLLHEVLDASPNDPVDAWDGKYKGKYVSPGVFVWRIAVELVDGTMERREGTVTVLR